MSLFLQSVAGIVMFALIALALSENRRRIGLKTAFIGIGLQFVVGLLLLKLSLFRTFFLLLNRLVLSLEESTAAGTAFVFGYLGGSPLPFDEKFPGAGYILAFRALPLVLIISALSALLFYWKILPLVVRAFSWALRKTMGIGGAEGLGVSANVFVGMVEAPLFIRPYLNHMTRSELFSLMTCGMATIAGTVMVLYASLLSRTIPDVMGHILTASIISVPAAITVSKIMVPETGELTSGAIIAPEKASGAMDAITRGTLTGGHARDQYRRHAGGPGRPGALAQPDPGIGATLARSSRHVATDFRPGHGAGDLVDGNPLGGDSHGGCFDGNQNSPQ